MLNEVLKDFIGAVELVLGALIANRGPVDKSLVINQICVDAATVSTRRITAETPIAALRASSPPSLLDIATSRYSEICPACGSRFSRLA